MGARRAKGKSHHKATKSNSKVNTLFYNKELEKYFDRTSAESLVALWQWIVSSSLKFMMIPFLVNAGLADYPISSRTCSGFSFFLRAGLHHLLLEVRYRRSPQRRLPLFSASFPSHLFTLLEMSLAVALYRSDALTKEPRSPHTSHKEKH